MKRMTAVVATVLSLVLGVSSLLAQSTPNATDGALIRAARKSQGAGRCVDHRPVQRSVGEA
jgi:hypothetical protein